MNILVTIWTLYSITVSLSTYKNGHYIIVSKVHTFGRKMSSSVSSFTRHAIIISFVSNFQQRNNFDLTFF